MTPETSRHEIAIMKQIASDYQALAQQERLL